ncbi:hypothetical protein [Azospirillum sp. TSA6c]|uniref:hypothetical protein n=1 Tax=Azospirillum sp. TSA6c TaxID=709813 RepID=UPI001FFFB986|nr:hypothetical protein [Azospirillum sp. TSA6c]
MSPIIGVEGHQWKVVTVDRQAPGLAGSAEGEAAFQAGVGFDQNRIAAFNVGKGLLPKALA